MDNLYRKKLEKIFNKIDQIASKGKDNFFEYYKYIDELIDKGDYSAFQQTLFYFYNIDTNNAQDVGVVKTVTWRDILFQTKSPFLSRLKKIYDDAQVYQISYDIFSTSPNAVQSTISLPLSYTFSYTGATNSVYINRVNDIFNLFILHPDVFQVNIFRADWVTQSNGMLEPDDATILQRISVTNSSVFQLDIPTTTGGQYLITSEQRNAGVTGSYKYYNYKVDVVKNSNLGSIREVEILSPDYKYLVQSKQYASILGARITYLEVQRTIDGTASYFDYNNPTYNEDQNLLMRYKMAVSYLNS
jgi:hypothetical protein